MAYIVQLLMLGGATDFTPHYHFHLPGSSFTNYAHAGDDPGYIVSHTFYTIVQGIITSVQH